MMKKLVSAIILASLTVFSAYAQEESGRVTMNGYASTVTSSIFEKISDPFINDYLIHNRLNFKGFITDNITIALELRNRLFTGDMVRGGTGYAGLAGADQGFIDMSWNLVSKQSFFLNTTADRLWLDLNYGKFQARLGRQRINWGQALVWNPNDIFNAYSYFDFDYVERPGSDAIRLQFFPDYSSTLELALKSDHDDDITAAVLYRFNKWSYDIQFLGGVFDNDELVAGAGWSGAFGSVSFRGEASWFQPFEKFADTTGTGIFTAGIDKFFSNNSMVQVQLMYCNNPVDFADFGLLYSRDMNVKDLAFSEFSAFASYSYPVTPLFNAGISSMWFPGLEGFFTGVSGDYSMAENVDFTCLWQHFNGKFGANRSKVNLAFIRIKLSF